MNKWIIRWDVQLWTPACCMDNEKPHKMLWLAMVVCIVILIHHRNKKLFLSAQSAFGTRYEFPSTKAQTGPDENRNSITAIWRSIHLSAWSGDWIKSKRVLVIYDEEKKKNTVRLFESFSEYWLLGNLLVYIYGIFHMNGLYADSIYSCWANFWYIDFVLIGCNLLCFVE